MLCNWSRWRPRAGRRAFSLGDVGRSTPGATDRLARRANAPALRLSSTVPVGLTIAAIFLTACITITLPVVEEPSPTAAAVWEALAPEEALDSAIDHFCQASDWSSRLQCRIEQRFGYLLFSDADMSQDRRAACLASAYRSDVDVFDFDMLGYCVENAPLDQAQQDTTARAARGDAGAQYDLAIMYHEGRGVRQDDTEAVRWLREAAERGHAAAQFGLASLHTVGSGVPVDHAQSVRWLRQVAMQGHVEAQFGLAMLYAIGEGVPEADDQAARWIRQVVRRFQQGAERGDAEAQFLLATLRLAGAGVPRDDVGAMRLLRQAAEQRHAWAQVALGSLYDRGVGVSRDAAEAVRWVRQAAEQGNVEAADELGRRYADGRGVPQDSVLAYMWFSIARALVASQPSVLARGISFRAFLLPAGPELTVGGETLRLIAEMSPDEISHAEELARVCMTSNYESCEP